MVLIKDAHVFYRKGKGNASFKGVVDQVVSEARQCSSKGDNFDRQLLRRLQRRDLNYQGCDIKIFKNSDYAIDIYNARQKIAIEIEKSEVKYIWRDFCKLAIGCRKRKINYAILIVPIKYFGQRKNQVAHTSPFATAKNISYFISDFLWNKNLAIIGYS